MKTNRAESPDDPYKRTGGLNLDSPTTKQAMMRLGIK